jgi:hypothetical protein
MPRITRLLRRLTIHRSGYMLYLVLIMLSIFGVLASVVFLSLRNTENSVISDMKKYQAHLLAESGIARAEFFLNGGDGHDLSWETDSLIETMENTGNIKMSCRHFGAYDKIVCRGARLNTSCIMTSIIGRNIPDTINPVITLSGSIRGLVVCSPMQLQGTVVLRIDSVYRYDNDGQSPKKKHDPSIKVINRASDFLPFSPAPLDMIFQNMQSALTQSMSDSNGIKGNVTIDRPNDSLLRRQTLIVFGNCDLKNVAIENKTIIVSGKLTLSDSVRSVFCAFIAKEIEIKSGAPDKCLFYSKGKLKLSGGDHNSQFFSEDSIIVGKNSMFHDMTLLVSRKNIGQSKSDTLQHGVIYYENGGSYAGCAICYCDSTIKKNNRMHGSSIVLGNACSFVGFLITDGDIEIGDNDIEGHVWAKIIIGRKNADKKINWLYARSIKPLRREMVFPLLGSFPMKIVKIVTKCEYRFHDYQKK